MSRINPPFKYFINKLKTDLSKETLSIDEKNELWNRICIKNKAYRRRKRLRVLTISTGIAASILIALIWKWAPQDMPSEQGVNFSELFTSITPEELRSADVQLLLSDQQKLSISNNESQIDYQKKGEVKINEKTLDIDAEKEQELNQLIVPVGKRASLILSDGTKMWVNSGSHVIFPAHFTGKHREIYLEGEIFLDVSHKEGMPFIVKTKEIDITVLGTQFNVSTLENKQSSEIVLVSGKVEITTKSQVKSILSPNDLFTYDLSTDKSSIAKVNVSDYIAWKDGYYQFNSLHMNKVLQKIARYYGIQIHWDEGVTQLICSGKLDLKDDPKDIFYLLEKAAPIEVEKRSGEYLVKVKP